MSEPVGEFALIARYLRPLAGAEGLGLLDDAALVDLPPGRTLVIAADALVAGIHFLPDDPPDLVARKLLRTNLSDLAAMGAEPYGYLTTLVLPRGTEEGWFAAFAAGLAADQSEFGVTLLGGDTTSTTGPVSLSLTILGTVKPGAALRRSGAAKGDAVYVSGTIGDAALGLLAARGGIADPTGFLRDRYRLPRPRLALGRALAGIASAAMDVSDGLAQDLGHICRASSVSMTVEAGRVPLSPEAQAAGRLDLCLTGGDDYELAFTVPPDRVDRLEGVAAEAKVAVTRIGEVTGDPGHSVTVRRDGAVLALDRLGWDHFARG